VVDVPDGADVDVRLGPLELGLGHWVPLLVVSQSCAISGVGLLGPGGEYPRPAGHSPVALAMISLATFCGTSA
jgi:hypothetical protein